MTGMSKRLTLGPVLIALLLGCAFLDEWLDGRALPGRFASWLGRETFPPGVVVFVLIATAVVLAARELSRILRSKGVHASMRMNSVLALLGVCVCGLVPRDWAGTDGAALVNASVAGVILFSLAVYARHQRVEGMVAAAGGALLSYAYLGLMMGFVILLRREHAVWILLWVVLTTKACDIGAFFTGTAIGRHKLIPWLSPGKTWEGLVGGVILAGAVGALGAIGLSRLGVVGLPHWTAALWAGVLFGLVGQIGDLLASLLKRDAKVKDSGRSLPGFGGVLDVIDSPALVMPVAYWWLRVFAGSGLVPGAGGG